MMQDDIRQNRPIKELPLSLYDFLFTPIGPFVNVWVTRSRTRTKMLQRIIPSPPPIGPDKMNRTTGVNTLLHDEVNVAFGTGFW